MARPYTASLESESEVITIGREWCKKEDVAESRAILLTARHTQSTTRALLESLARGLPRGLVGISRKEVTRGGMTETLVLCEYEMDIGDQEFGKHATIRVAKEQLWFKIIPLGESLQSTDSTERMMVRELGYRDNNTTPVTELQYTLASSYRRLKFFSGKDNLSRDEEEWSSWVEQVEGLMAEWTGVSEIEKRKRIRESLRPPASQIISDLKQDLPSATSEDYLAALEAVFGTTESGEELLIKYHSMKQNNEEKPSAYLSRLQSAIRHVLRKGGLVPGDVNRIRLRQFIRGLLFDDLLITTLQLRDRLTDPPGFISLLSMLRRYEEEQDCKSQQRQSRNNKTQRKPVGVTAASITTTSEEKPKKEMNDLKASDRLERLEAEVRALKVSGSPKVVEPESEEAPREYRQWTSGNNRNQSPNFCFNCGRTGHISRTCRFDPDIQTVNRKLIQFVLGQGNPQGSMGRGTQGSNT